MFPFFTAILIHELGHILAAILCHVPFRGIRFFGMGIEIAFDFSSCSYVVEVFVHLAGSMFGLICGILWYRIFQNTLFLGISFFLSVINLLPIRGFDGGGVVGVLFPLIFPLDVAEKLTHTVSILTVCFLFLCVVWIEVRVGANLELLFFLISVMIGAAIK